MKSEPLDRCRLSLDGLSTGDAFGECFFTSKSEILRMIRSRRIPAAPWRWTDDTEMALSIVEVLQKHGTIEQDELAQAFAKRMDPARGYGRAAFEILNAVRAGKSWRTASASAFQGQGSFGNGTGMRAAPIGAFFHDDLARVKEEARRSAEPTHLHQEGIAGAIAVAVAAALATRGADDRDAFLREIIEHTPNGYTQDGIRAALALDASADIVDAAVHLGNGTGVSAPDTVPLCLFVAARNLGSYEDGLWDVVSALGDRDTTSAITGGILALSAGEVPLAWIEAREPLPAFG